MMNFFSDDLKVGLLTNKAISGSESSSEFDTVNLIGNVAIAISVRASGTGTSVPVLEHSDSSGSGFESVPANGIVSITTSEVTTLSNLTTAASFQVVALRRDYLRRYVRVSYSGGTTHNVAAFAAALKKYTEVS